MYKLINFFAQFAIPIVVGAPVCLYFFASIFQYNLPFFVPLAAAFAVLAVYLFDHLLDNQKANLAGVKNIHFEFIAKYKRFFKLLTLFCFVMALTLVVLFFRGKLLFFSLVPALLTIAYFSALPIFETKWKVKFELIVIAFVVTFAMAGIPALLGNNVNWIWILLFFIVCIQNLLLFAWIDFERDSLSLNASIATVMGVPFVVWVFDILCVVSIAFIADLWQDNGPNSILFVFFFMQVYLLLFRLLFEKRKPLFIWRFWVDAVFLIPLIYWI